MNSLLMKRILENRRYYPAMPLETTLSLSTIVWKESNDVSCIGEVSAPDGSPLYLSMPKSTIFSGVKDGTISFVVEDQEFREKIQRLENHFHQLTDRTSALKSSIEDRGFCDVIACGVGVGTCIIDTDGKKLKLGNISAGLWCSARIGVRCVYLNRHHFGVKLCCEELLVSYTP